MKSKIHKKHILIVLILLISITLLFGYIKFLEFQNLQKPIILGVSFSPEYAKQLNLNPHQIYLSILDDLKIKQLRLNAYWNEIEPAPDQYNFKELDFYLDEAYNHQAQVTLAVGYKLPRWPECRAPAWIKADDLITLRAEQLKMVQTVITHHSTPQK